jgi:hypothetical protein
VTKKKSDITLAQVVKIIKPFSFGTYEEAKNVSLFDPGKQAFSDKSNI